MEKKLTIGSSVLLLALMMALIITSMTAFQAEPHIPLLICLVVVSIIGLFLNIKWDELEKAMIKGVTDGTKAIIILSLVGIVIAVWMMSGTVPTILFYGLTFITPEWFAVSALIICMIVSSFTGSSFTTIGSVGVAMMGIGLALGVNPAMAAGAIICGACFGDKMSPLSDTTNLASGVTGVDLFVHIRHLMWTTIPSFLITLIIFFFIGRSYSTTNVEGIQEMLTTLDASFSISFLTLLSPLIVVILAFIRFPTVPALVVGILTGLVTVGFVQGNWLISEWFTVVQHGFFLETGNDAINAIVDAGGLQSMMWSISLVIIALLLGSLIQRIGLIDGLLEFFRSFLLNRGNLIGATAASSISVNALTGEQYLSILLPGKAFEMHYERLNIAKKNLSRTLEDAGTLVNPLIPWGVSGAFFASTLGVAVMDYIPFAFFLFLSPILTILFGYLGIGVGKSIES